MLSDNELALIKYLRKNARQKIVVVAKKLRVPKSTLFDVLRKLEGDKIVMHKTLINFEKIGYPVRMMVALKAPQERERLRDFLSTHHAINNFHTINMGYDFLFEAIFQTQKEAQEFLDTLQLTCPSVEKQVFNVIEDIQRERFLAQL